MRSLLAIVAMMLFAISLGCENSTTATAPQTTGPVQTVSLELPGMT